MPHHPVAFSGPVERCRGGHSSVHPVVGVLDGNLFACMGEPSVLDPSSVEIFSFTVLERECHAVASEFRRCGPFYDLVPRPEVGHCQNGTPADLHLYLRSREDCRTVFKSRSHFPCIPSRAVRKYPCRRVGLRVTDNPAAVVLEHAENLRTVKVYDTDLSVTEYDFRGGSVDLPDLFYPSGILPFDRDLHQYGYGGVCQNPCDD